MSTETKPIVDADTAALMVRILHATPLPPDVYKRIRARGDELREGMRREYGTVGIAVDLVRQTRDEE